MPVENKEVLLGGQAVIEGVMMRGPGMVATAVRRPDGSIIVRKEAFTPLAQKSRLWRLPLLRGAGGLVEMMALGVRTLNFSAEVAMDEGQPGSAQGKIAGKREKLKDTLRIGLMVAVSLSLAVALFIVTPLFLTTVLFDMTQDPLRFNLVAGLTRLLLFLGYLGLISRMRDVQRLFMYHGAEHMAVFAYEKERTLDAGTAAKHSRFHPRCGTSFLLVVMLAAIFLFSLTDVALLNLLGSISFPVRLASHLLMLPLVGGFSYEVIRFSAKRMDTLVGRIAIAPGLWLQRITTRVPEEDQLEVAVTALRAALDKEREIETPENVVFQGFSVN